MNFNVENLLGNRANNVSLKAALKAAAIEFVFSDYPSAISGADDKAAADYDQFLLSQEYCFSFKPNENFEGMSHNQLAWLLNGIYVNQIVAISAANDLK